MTLKSPRDVIVRPVVSEKSYAGLEQNTYPRTCSQTASIHGTARISTRTPLPAFA